MSEGIEHHYSIIVETRTLREMLVSANDPQHAERIATELLESVPTLGNEMTTAIFIHDKPREIALEDLSLHIEE